MKAKKVIGTVASALAVLLLAFVWLFTVLVRIIGRMASKIN